MTQILEERSLARWDGGSDDDQIEESCAGILETQKSISQMQFNVIRNIRCFGMGKNKTTRCTR